VRGGDVAGRQTDCRNGRGGGRLLRGSGVPDPVAEQGCRHGDGSATILSSDGLPPLLSEAFGGGRAAAWRGGLPSTSECRPSGGLSAGPGC